MPFKGRKCSCCGNSATNDKSLLLYRFLMPTHKNIDRAKAWAEFAFPDKNWCFESLMCLFRTGRVICENHFAADSFLNSTKLRLHQKSLPTIIIPKVSYVRPLPPTFNKLRTDIFQCEDHQYCTNTPEKISPKSEFVEEYTNVEFLDILPESITTNVETCDIPPEYITTNVESCDLPDNSVFVKESTATKNVAKTYIESASMSTNAGTCNISTASVATNAKSFDFSPLYTIIRKSKSNNSKSSDQTYLPEDNIPQIKHIKGELIKESTAIDVVSTTDANTSISTDEGTLAISSSSITTNDDNKTLNPQIKNIKLNENKTPIVKLTVKSVRVLSKNELTNMKRKPEKIIPITQSSANKNVFIKNSTPSYRYVAPNNSKKFTNIQTLTSRALMKSKELEHYKRRVDELKKKCLAQQRKTHRAKKKIEQLKSSNLKNRLPELPKIDRATAITSSITILKMNESKFCRACLGTNDLNTMQGVGKKLRPLFELVTSVKLSPDELVYVCEPCLAILEYMCKFKEQCIEVDETLKKFQKNYSEEPDPFNNEIILQIQKIDEPNEAHKELFQPASINTSSVENQNILNDVINKWKGKSKKSKILTLSKKYELIQEIDQKILSRRKLALKYGISIGTLICTLKNRNRIEKAVNKNTDQAMHIKKIPKAQKQKYRQLELLLYEYFSDDIENTTNTQWRQKAKSLAEEMDMDSFDPNYGWLKRFKTRFNIGDSQKMLFGKMD